MTAVLSWHVQKILMIWLQSRIMLFISPTQHPHPTHPIQVHIVSVGALAPCITSSSADVIVTLYARQAVILMVWRF